MTKLGCKLNIIHRKRKQPWRRRPCFLLPNQGEQTVDTEFELYVERLEDYFAACTKLKKGIRNNEENTTKWLEKSFQAAWVFQKVFSEENLQNTSTHNKTSEEENAQRYFFVMKEIENDASSSMRLLKPSVIKFCDRVLEIIGNARKHILSRDKDLARYDRIMNQVNSMSITNLNGITTYKEVNTYEHLNAKLENYRKKYMITNNQMLTEFPFLFKLLDSASKKIVQCIYYNHLAIVYSVNTGLISLSRMLDMDVSSINSPKFYQQMLDSFPIPDTSAFTIIAFQRNHLRQLVESSTDLEGSPIQNHDPLYEYCIAVFSYVSQEKGDLNFEEGAVIKVIEKRGDWWYGETELGKGVFPSNYVIIRQK